LASRGESSTTPPTWKTSPSIDACSSRRLEQDRGGVQLAAAPGWPFVEELRPGEADDESADVPNRVGEVLDQVEQRRLAPVNVLEDEQKWPLMRERLDEPAHRPERLLLDGPACAGADRGVETLSDGIRIWAALEQLADAATGGRLPDDLPHGPEGDPFPV